MKHAWIALMFLSHVLLAGEKPVTGTVTYVAAGTVYTSLGRESGVQDSTLLYVKANGDSIAVLRVLAVSSKSSACTIIRAKRDIMVGNIVIGAVTVATPHSVPVDSTKAATLQSSPPSPSRGTLARPAPSVGSLVFRGRVSAQYFSTRYDIASYNTTQPGLVINLHGQSTDIPLKFEIYSNLRTLSYGTVSPFSRGATNQSRIYRLSLQYDDGLNDFSLGRIIPAAAPSIGYIDGVMYSRRFGRMSFGTTVGYQPGYTLRGISTEYKKLALFATVQPQDSMNMTISTAYARTYARMMLDREVVSGGISWYTLGGIQLYAYAECDLRKAVGTEFVLRPALTSLFVNMNYRLAQFLSVGLGVDASRPLYTYTAALSIPEEFREARLRSGLSGMVSFYLPGGVMLSNTYSPRTSETSFARVYSNFSSLGVANVLGSGISFRSNVNLNANEYSQSQGFGANMQRNIFDMFDVSIRYQQNSYSLKTYDDKHVSRTIGADLYVVLTRDLGVMVSYDRLNGYGLTSNSLFAELSVRF
jgi:hypothetical protein